MKPKISKHWFTTKIEMSAIFFWRITPIKKTVSHVVYQYTCAMEGCQPHQSYIGYTTTSVKQRMTTHAQNGAIKNHNLNEHNSRISTNVIINQIKILFSATDKIDLQIPEALLIKKHNPPLNNQSDTFTRSPCAMHRVRNGSRNYWNVL